MEKYHGKLASKTTGLVDVYYRVRVQREKNAPIFEGLIHFADAHAPLSDWLTGSGDQMFYIAMKSKL